MAAKAKTVYVCQECGYETGKWLGKCPDCGSWNSLVETVRTASRPRHPSAAASGSGPTPAPLSTWTTAEAKRTMTGIAEFDRVLGGGIVRGSIVLAGGEPGIGKSTLFLQAAEAMTRHGRVLYVSGEESAEQVGMRAQRIGVSGSMLFLPETQLDAILAAADVHKPDHIIIDSIQTVYDPEIASAPGSISQVRECAGALARRAKETGAAVFIIGHVTKEGSIAGPRVLEHLVDTVLYFEGERMSQYRILRAVKNRFGSTDEIGVFEMCEDGMRQVENPSQLLLSGLSEPVAGTALYCALEGTRPVLAEVEALVTQTTYASPRRLSTGVDYNRTSMLIAVLEKKIGLKLYNQDIFANATGGIRMTEPGSDLAIAAAIVTALRGRPARKQTVYMGEIGLTGELRRVSQLEKRLAECSRLGVARAIVPAGAPLKGFKAPGAIEVCQVKTLGDALAELF